nr:hypothetical protein HK105_006988 [Polyrhizophydium stewartii]
MATTEDDFQEILSAESYVDVQKLRSAAQHGVPDEVWKYLLGVSTADKSNELSRNRNRYREYLEYDKENTAQLKRVRGETSRYCWRRKKEFEKLGGGNPEQRIENVVGAFLNVHQQSPLAQPEVLVPMCGPLSLTMSGESEVFFSLERLAEKIDELHSTHDLNQRLANFLMLFRILMPDLYSHFEEEEVNFREWAASWFQHLLARELPLESVLRLWDTYFSATEGLTLHVYVCLAILAHIRDNLEDLEQSEIHSLLLRLPAMDMDKIISQAFRIKYEVLEKALTELD